MHEASSMHTKNDVLSCCCLLDCALCCMKQFPAGEGPHELKQALCTPSFIREVRLTMVKKWASSIMLIGSRSAENDEMLIQLAPTGAYERLPAMREHAQQW